MPIPLPIAVTLTALKFMNTCKGKKQTDEKSNLANLLVVCVEMNHVVRLRHLLHRFPSTDKTDSSRSEDEIPRHISTYLHSQFTTIVVVVVTYALHLSRKQILAQTFQLFYHIDIPTFLTFLTFTHIVLSRLVTSSSCHHFCYPFNLNLTLTSPPTKSQCTLSIP